MTEKLNPNSQTPEQQGQELDVEAERQKRIEELADINEKDFAAEQERVSEEFPEDAREAVRGLNHEEIADLKNELQEFVDSDAANALDGLSVSPKTEQAIKDLIYSDHVQEAVDALYPTPEGEEADQEVIGLRERATEILTMSPEEFEVMSEVWRNYDDVQAAAELRQSAESNSEESNSKTTAEKEENEPEKQSTLSEVDADELLSKLEKTLGIGTQEEVDESAESETEEPKPEKIADLTDEERNEKIQSLYSSIVESVNTTPETQTIEETKAKQSELIDAMAQAFALMFEDYVKKEVLRREQERSTKTVEEAPIERDTADVNETTQKLENATNTSESTDSPEAQENRKLTIRERLKEAAIALGTSGPRRVGRAWEAFKRKTANGEVIDDPDNDAEEAANPNQKRRKIIGWAVAATAVAAAGVVLLVTRDENAAIQAQEAVQGFIPQAGGGSEHISSAVDQAGALPAHEFSEAAQTATEGEGWFNTIREATGITSGNQLREVLKDVGDQLVAMGEAYEDPNIGGYGISSPGEISDEALNLIRDDAIRRGFINQ